LLRRVLGLANWEGGPVSVERCTHCGWLIEYREDAGVWVHSDGRFFCWDTEDYKDPDYAQPRLSGVAS